MEVSNSKYEFSITTFKRTVEQLFVFSSHMFRAIIGHYQASEKNIENEGESAVYCSRLGYPTSSIFTVDFKITLVDHLVNSNYKVTMFLADFCL